MAVRELTRSEEAQIKAYGDAWGKAYAAGDQAGMDAAHAGAEAVRAQAGYSGGADGSQTIALPSTSTGSSSSGGSKTSSSGGGYTNYPLAAGTTTTNKTLPATAGTTPSYVQYSQNSGGTTSWQPADTSGNNYASMAGMSALHQAALEAAGQSWQDAYARGDQAGMAAAHQQAEAIRALYNYSGGADGSQYIPGGQPIDGDSTNNRPSYTDKYSSSIDTLLNQILNRDAFSYNALDDPLYQQYSQQYRREGQRAMQDALGAASARTGGLASSWATTAAQQANDYYASQLADKIPELYQLAYSMYLDDIDLKVQDMGLLQNASNTQYNRYRDTMSDWRDDRNFAYDMYRDHVADGRYDKEYSDSMDMTAAQLLAQAGDFSGYQQLLGLSDEQVDALVKQFQEQADAGNVNPGEIDNGKNSGGKGYDNGSLTDAQIRAMQRYFGTEVDGMWGSASVEAADGMTADQAWEAYIGRDGGLPLGALSASLISGAGDQAIVDQARKFVETYPDIAWNSRTVDYMLADSGLTSAERELFKEYLKTYGATWGTNAK